MNAKSQLTQQLALDLLRPLQPSLDNFVPGRSAEALDALRRLTRAQLPDRIVYLWGEAGSGRTHLLQALASEPGAFWWSADKAPEQPGISLIDDVESLGPDAQIALFNRLNAARADTQCACVAAGSVAPTFLPLRDDVRTRLAWGYVYQLHPLSDDEKRAALAQHAQSRGMLKRDPQANHDVFDALLKQLPRDMRTLVAALDALDAYALARKRALTPALVREWLGNSAQA